eukprot:Gb_37331 [translate_table: standard]
MGGLRALRLSCTVQHYEWGRIGEESEVGRLHSLMNKTEIQQKPYAELWIGTHDSGHSLVMLDNQVMRLKDWLQQHPEALGDRVVNIWGIDLPFLFKVLSVAKALSIQAHPDKELAKMLHDLHPNVYKDGNHKPEMALALTEFEALCGFVSAEEVKDVIRTVPEIEILLGEFRVKALLNIEQNEQRKDDLKASLRSSFTQLMTLSKDTVEEVLSNLKIRLNKEMKAGHPTPLERCLTSKEQLVLGLEKQYPADVGVISAFLFNYVKLAPGEAIYLDANEPHAYLYGECVECMATSDNVVRAGLTPKFRDVDTLCSMLTYKQGLPEILQGIPLNPFTKRYSPPFSEFEVDRCMLPSGQRVTFPEIPGPSVFLILDGEGVMVQEFNKEELISSLGRGDVFFVPAGIQLTISAVIEANEDAEKTSNPLHLYRAGVNSCVFEG